MVGAIDIGSATVSGCVLEIQRAGMKVLQYETLPVEPEGKEEAIRSLIGRLNLAHVKQVVANLDQPVFVRNLEFPFSDLKKIEPLISYELDDQIPMDVEDLVITHGHTVSRDKTEVLVVAAAREGVAQQLQMLSACGVEVTKLVHPGNPAMFFSGPTDPCTVVIDLGARVTHMAALVRGTLRTLRSWTDGMESMVAALARYSSQEEHQVRDWLSLQGRITAPGQHEEGFEQVIRTEVERFFEEWRRFILSFQTRHQETVERVVLIGNGARLPGLATAAASFFGVPVQVGMVPGETLADPKKASVVALAHLGVSGEALNFRRGEFALGARDSLVKKKALAVSLGLSFFFTMMVGSSLFTLWRLEKEERDLLGLTGQLSSEVLGKQLFDPAAIKKQIKQKTSKTRANGSDQFLPRMSAWVLLSQISEKMPLNAALEGDAAPGSAPPAPVDPAVAPVDPSGVKPGEKPEVKPETREEAKTLDKGVGEDGKDKTIAKKEEPIAPVRVDIQKIHVRPGKVSIGGVVNNAQEVDEIIRGLRRIPCFQEIAPGAIKTVGTGEEEKREFSIEITMDCI
ncbi:MAG: hypothetical protein CVU59_00655 [Deltaproteobacteria bacterium HGW-Deltaproteobacteria-17]|nr:MAG: hypothetical protein CVU59_00655 [Deltaproteobacteria bacterium HGW-Deltaproteobacteria-17]